MIPTPLAERNSSSTAAGSSAIAASASAQSRSTACLQRRTARAARSRTIAAKAKRVIFLFMAGAPSHLELFDNKPQLAKFDGTLPPPELLKGYRAAFINPNSKLLGPKFKFAKHGQSGAELSELLPHLAEVVDDIAIVKSMVTDAFNHAPAQIFMNTGTPAVRPAEHRRVGHLRPRQRVAGPARLRRLQHRQEGAERRQLATGAAASCRRVYQGVPFRSGGDPVLYLSNPPGVDADDAARLARRASSALNQQRLDVVGDPEIATRISAFEMAFRMQTSAPELMDLAEEPKQTLDMYGAEPGKPSFANNCLLARRLVERGVRFVQLFHEAWDQHGDLVNGPQERTAATPTRPARRSSRT